ncbi:MAG TPA: terminase small subunit [Hyphomicrobiaceae bacterium]
MSTLTAKEEAFAQAVAGGAKLSDAYRASRECSKMATSTINANAKKLARKPAIKARIEELRRGESKESRESLPSPEPIGASGLTPKQERFCELYVEKSNASEAYRLSHDVSPDTKPETIHNNAYVLLKSSEVTARIEAIRAELRRRHEITTDYLVQKLRPIIEADIRKVVTWGAAVPLKDPVTGEIVVVQDIVVREDLDDAAAAMIAKIVRGKDGSLRVELHDKLAAIEKVARLLGLIRDQHDVTVADITPRPQDPGREVMRAAIRRVREAAIEYEKRMEAERAAKALPATSHNGKGAAEH